MSYLCSSIHYRTSYYFTNSFFRSFASTYMCLRYCTDTVRVGVVWFGTICKEIGVQVMTQVNRSVIVLHFNCFTFRTYWILFCFVFYSLLLLSFSWVSAHIESIRKINQCSGLFIIGGVIETHFILFYSFARKTQTKNATERMR